MNHRLSLFTDDATLFVRPKENELIAAKELLQVFYQASGLQANLNKSAITPIRCEKINVEELAHHFPCPIKAFPYSYLGMPLSCTNLAKVELQP